MIWKLIFVIIYIFQGYGPMVFAKSPPAFKSRKEAGHLLASALMEYANQRDGLILALPRGGVPIACEVSKIINIPFDIFLVRKLGVPGNEEVAMGAIAQGNVVILNHELISSLSLRRDDIDRVLMREMAELKRRDELYCPHLNLADLQHKTVILIDDGAATGFTLFAAIAALKRYSPQKVIVGLPVAPPEVIRQLSFQVDEVVCLCIPENFLGVGAYYAHFEQLSDEKVCELLKERP